MAPRRSSGDVNGQQLIHEQRMSAVRDVQLPGWPLLLASHPRISAMASAVHRGFQVPARSAVAVKLGSFSAVLTPISSRFTASRPGAEGGDGQ